MAITKNIIFEAEYAIIAEKLWTTDQVRANFQKTKYMDRLLDVWLIAGMVGYIVKSENLEYEAVDYSEQKADKRTIFIETINKNFTEINQYLQLVTLMKQDNLSDEENLKLIFLNEDRQKNKDYDQERMEIYQEFVKVGLTYIDAKWLVDENPENVLTQIMNFVETYQPHEDVLIDEYEASALDMMETLGW
ncbi:MAG: hypothetical protein ACRC17_00590 [Culicoidibacterales bacterium]